MNVDSNSLHILRAADGVSLRVPVNNRWIPGSTWGELAELAQQTDQHLYLTDSGNIRIRGLEEAKIGDVCTAISSMEWGNDVSPQESSSISIGWIQEQKSAPVDLGAGVKLGILPAQIAEILAAIDHPTRINHQRRLLISGLPEALAEQILRILAPAGLIFDEHSSWNRISACIGAPHCSHALSYVRHDASQLATTPLASHVHLVGCRQRCGQPQGPHQLYQATGEGEYDVLDH
ncbi:hypothetical protein GP475_05835 [Corynebacterium poyangense]|uniref:Nitrite/Sulfite reductase ferredoxin-like domain-containing protein n=1 Tax=Corynebacterium poyangense TaxID=2684405 RepID=A0A7H0SNT8_9CORY|nr:hypothetical protein [Corynebacterium poyangense]QNQ90213.1 hypothetical protein GP475_05835 [Corynebacterium poyangense]